MKYKKFGDGKLVQKQDYSKRVLFDLSNFTEKGHWLQLVTIPPQTKQRAHVHHLQTEVEYIAEGEATFIINGEDIQASKGDAFVIEPGDKHNVWNKSDNSCQILVFKINYPEDGESDSEWLEE